MKGTFWQADQLLVCARSHKTSTIWKQVETSHHVSLVRLTTSPSHLPIEQLSIGSIMLSMRKRGRGVSDLFGDLQELKLLSSHMRMF